VVHLFFSLPTGLLLSQVRRVGAPSVVSLRGSDVPGYDTSNPQLQLFHKAMLPVTRWIWRHAGHVVALSDSLGRLARATDPDLRYSVIRNGVDTQLFRPSERSSPAETDLTCISVARLVDRKGFPDLLRAMQEPGLGSMRLEIVGGGAREDELRGLTSSLGIDERVTFLGSLDRESVAERLRRADIFVLAPRSEAFGNAFAEALASGLPIVGTNVGGIPEFIEDGVNGLLVPPGDPQRLAGALQTLASDPQRRLEMGSRNRDRAMTQLSWDRVAACYMDVYQQLVEKKGDDSHRD
jgi:glycosyltransferase involved in cell wall biosynthesis